MECRYLLDTNICIYALSGRHPALTDRLGALPAGMAMTSVVVLGELLYGIAKSRRRQDAQARLDALLRATGVATLPDDAARHYGEIRAALEARRLPIGANDLWIAAHARAADLVLVTNNERAFRRVPDLQVENWLAKAAR